MNTFKKHGHVILLVAFGKPTGKNLFGGALAINPNVPKDVAFTIAGDAINAWRERFKQ